MINDPGIMQLVQDEYAEYQSMVEDEISSKIWEESAMEKGRYWMDIIWGSLKTRFPNLSAIAITVLVVPLSNAGDERVFSMIKKNKTDFRSNLQLGGSLNSIMRIKMAFPESLIPCHQWTPSDDLLTACKKATKKYNDEHNSSK